jgi:hypothetical protein
MLHDTVRRGAIRCVDGGSNFRSRQDFDDLILGTVLARCRAARLFSLPCALEKFMRRTEIRCST